MDKVEKNSIDSIRKPLRESSYLCKYAGVPVKEVFIQDGVIVGKSLC